MPAALAAESRLELAQTQGDVEPDLRQLLAKSL